MIVINKVKAHPATTCDWGDNIILSRRGGCFMVATWFVEGGFYCPDHKDRVIKILTREVETA